MSVEEYKKKGNLDLYEEIFEKPFLAATGEFYREEAAKLLGEGRWGEELENWDCLRMIYKCPPLLLALMIIAPVAILLLITAELLPSPAFRTTWRGSSLR